MTHIIALKDIEFEDESRPEIDYVFTTVVTKAGAEFQAELLEFWVDREFGALVKYNGPAVVSADTYVALLENLVRSGWIDEKSVKTLTDATLMLLTTLAEISRSLGYDESLVESYCQVARDWRERSANTWPPRFMPLYSDQGRWHQNPILKTLRARFVGIARYGFRSSALNNRSLIEKHRPIGDLPRKCPLMRRQLNRNPQPR